MKRTLSILSLALLCFGCKKPEQTKETEVQKEQAKYPVHFSISDLAASTEPMNTPSAKSTLAANEPIKNYADNLYYRIYNANGSWVKSIDQSSENSSFGSIRDTLPSGTYTVFMAAARGRLGVSGSNTVNLSSSYYFPSSFGVWNDTFSKTFILTVGTTAVNQSVSLDRVVAGLKVTIEDAIPANVAKISLVISPEVGSLYPDGSTVYASNPKSADFTLSSSDIGVKGKTFSICVANTVSATSVSVRAYNSAGTLLVEKTVSSLKFEKSKRINLTGSLFGSTSNTSSGFTVTVNPDWTDIAPVKY